VQGKRSVITIYLTTIFILNWSFSIVVHGQQGQIDPNNGGYWVSYTGDNKLNKRMGIHSEGQIRNFGIARTMNTFLVRVGLNVYIQPYAMATVGYGYFFSNPSSSNVVGSKMSENRIWQQLILRQKSRFIFMEHRYRLEQRFFHNLTNDTYKEDHRLRYRFQTLFPLYSISPHLRHLFVVINDELMMNFRSDPSKLFDRNRFFVGIGYQVSPKMNFQLGYQNQFAYSGTGKKGAIDHILQFGVSYNMDDLMQTFFKGNNEKQ